LDRNNRNNNSLHVTVRKQLSHGLAMQAPYTWSKDLTELCSRTAYRLQSEIRLAGSIYGTAGAVSQSGYARAQMCPGMSYGSINTPGGLEQRLGGNSGGPGNLNAASFCAAPTIGDGTGYGDSGTGILLGPGQFNWDISALKTTRITERQVIQFRAEFFNIFNHPQFTNPNAGQGAIYSLPDRASGSFGQITSTSVNPRVIQFALKYIF